MTNETRDWLASVFETDPVKGIREDTLDYVTEYHAYLKNIGWVFAGYPKDVDRDLAREKAWDEENGGYTIDNKDNEH